MRAFVFLFFILMAIHVSYAQIKRPGPKTSMPPVKTTTTTSNGTSPDVDTKLVTPPDYKSVAPPPTPVAVAPYEAPKAAGSPPTAEATRPDGEDSTKVRKPYCSVMNFTSDRIDLDISDDNSNWRSRKTEPYQTVYVSMENHVYLRILNAATQRYYYIIGYPWEHYKIGYYNGLKIYSSDY